MSVILGQSSLSAIFGGGCASAVRLPIASFSTPRAPGGMPYFAMTEAARDGDVAAYVPLPVCVYTGLAQGHDGKVRGVHKIEIHAPCAIDPVTLAGLRGAGSAVVSRSLSETKARADSLNNAAWEGYLSRLQRGELAEVSAWHVEPSVPAASAQPAAALRPAAFRH